MPIHHFASLFHSTTTSNTLSPKVRVEYSCGSVEYTTACSTLGPMAILVMTNDATWARGNFGDDR